MVEETTYIHLLLLPKSTFLHQYYKKKKKKRIIIVNLNKYSECVIINILT